MVDIQASPAEVRSIARDAHIYGYPMVDSYRILHTYFVEKDSPEYKGDWNQLKSTPRVYTPDDKAVQTPNSDTPYSMLGMDLRAEPMVLSIPAIDGNRYFSVQFVDLYTHNFNYLGSRASGNDGGRYLVAGPGWKGEIPEGITEVIRSETNLLLAIYRTQLFDVDDLDNVKEIQSGYKAQPLSQFLGASAAPAAPSVEFMTPLTPETQKSSLQIFNLLNFLLQFCPTHPSEVELMQRFSRIGVGAGKTILIRGACRALGVTEPVTSPTFTIGHRYRGRMPVSHLDLYRLEGLDREDPGLLEDYLDPDSVALVEWPESAAGSLEGVRARVTIRHAGGDEREVEIQYP